MSHNSISRRRPRALPSLIALAAILVAASLGLAACGGSSSTTTTTETTANAASTGATAAGTSSSSTTSAGTSSTSTTPGTSSTSTTPGTSSTGTSSTGTSTAGAPPAGRAARFAAVRTCLSKKGITFPQSGAAGSPGSGGHLPKGMSSAQFAEALRSCSSSFSGSRFGKGGRGVHGLFNNPRFHSALERFAACMRQNGVNVGVPNTSGKGPVFATKGINTGSAKFKAAAAACRSTLQSSRAHPGTSVG